VFAPRVSPPGDISLTDDAPILADPILARVENGWGRLTLNRPKALHALSLEMCERMIAALLVWRDDPSVLAVLIDHTGARGFCAGGDIRQIAEGGQGDGAGARAFFLAEYRLNHLMFVYPKPIVAIMDGVTMGGGVGISAPAQYQVATERTVFAMPETGIGLFPDVGGGWFLPRLRGESGIWLGLTGARLKAADCLWLGLATNYVEANRIEALKAALLQAPNAIDTVLAEFDGDAGPPSLAQVKDPIDRLFVGDTVEAILEGLEADGSDWAAAQLATLTTKSPQALKVTLRQLREGRARTSFADEMAVEFRLAVRICRRPDFQEGVRAVIVDKDNAPRWKPQTLAEVDDALLDALFAPLSLEQAWTPL
jgi:enoyl-CoA hydratase